MWDGAFSAANCRAMSPGENTLCCALVTAECLIVSWGRSSHLLFQGSRWIFAPGTKPSLSFTPHISRWTQHCQTQRLHCLLSTPACLAGQQTPLQSITMTSLQCHSTLTVISAACSSSVLNLPQIFKVGITRVTPVSSQGRQTTDLYNSITILFLSHLLLW